MASIRTVSGRAMDRRAFTLQPLIAQGILHPGNNRLSCAVGGIDYFAGQMPRAMHRFLLATVQPGPHDRHSRLVSRKFCTAYVCLCITHNPLTLIPSLTSHPSKKHISVDNVVIGKGKIVCASKTRRCKS